MDHHHQNPPVLASAGAGGFLRGKGSGATRTRWQRPASSPLLPANTAGKGTASSILQVAAGKAMSLL